MNRSLLHAVLVAGLAAVGWVGMGYIGSNALALFVAGLIAVFYGVGAVELHRFHEATATLARATAALSEPPATLADWLDTLHPSLRNAVRLRVEGERVGLPGPALTPYLVGLLVLLGMLGTFVGMVATLKGTGMALDSATDLEAVRASLSAPVKGLGLAFGTSVAGVAASAMLGLASALCRRERLRAGQLLDTRIATSLRVHSLAHQREESFRLLQQQAQVMPDLVRQLHAVMTTMEQQSVAISERLTASQDHFHARAEAAYAGLAASVGQSLRQSLTESARIAGATIQPVVETTMAGIARETTALHDKVASTVQLQLEGLSGRFETMTTDVADTWRTALVEQQRTNEALSTDLRGTLGQFTETFEQRSASLVEDISTRLQSTVGSVSDTWGGALAQHERTSEKLSADTQQALAAAAASFEQHSAALLAKVDASHANLQTELAARDEQRLSAWNQSLESMAASLQQEWQQAGAHAATQQQQQSDALARTARDIAAQSEAHATHTIAETARLLEAASEAPKAAAEVVAELRQKLSDSMARDNAMLEERSHILETLGTLLDAVNHASTEQRGAIDALVASSADLLERVGSRFTEQLEAETGKMGEVAAQLTGSAVEVASLGEAFGHAVGLFSESNDKLVGHLQRIEAALGKSIARSDEQLAYYVAQAREVIDLSIMSQKQVVEDLQQIANRQATAGSEA
ncbi:Uncharacterized protein conserved in bacteria [Variovorax sp. HW608]|uniref:DUF802 domain-containing protein n=1 Tax=Variovorax sp. HW608 TaxID=1034889 RepID=UPI0008201F5D|nr:DUF802 domain-containing protein [Variovorax sp. HW608]SCK31408.1 Uncharacterized protein conserved in bacteria [Variovorax sp. HW608]